MIDDNNVVPEAINSCSVSHSIHRGQELSRPSPFERGDLYKIKRGYLSVLVDEFHFMLGLSAVYFGICRYVGVCGCMR